MRNERLNCSLTRPMVRRQLISHNLQLSAAGAVSCLERCFHSSLQDVKLQSTDRERIRRVS